MKMVATVERPTGRTWHLFLASSENQAAEVQEFPTAATVEIVPEDGGWQLIRYDGSGEFCGDTWHLTLQEAKHQASFEYGILDSGWSAVDSDD